MLNNQYYAKIKSFTKNIKFSSQSFLLLVLLFYLPPATKKPVQTATVTTGNVTETALLSGKAQTAARADLGFGTSGRIQNIYVKNNQHVTKGQLLARLEIGDLLAQRAEAEAQIKGTASNEDTKVTNAYRTLLSDDLTLTADSDSYS